VTLCGLVVTLISAFRLPFSRLDLKFFVLAGFTLLVARITISIPRARGRVSVSDLFVFLTLLLYGAEAAVLLATVDAFFSSIYFSKRTRIRAFNASVMGVSTFITALVASAIFGNWSDLRVNYSAKLMVALLVIAAVQYATNSIIATVSLSLKSGEAVWTNWHRNFRWASITYLASAFGAETVARLLDELGPFALIAAAPIITIIYFTYRTYLRNIEASAAQAELAHHHVAELNHLLYEQARTSKALQESEAHFRSAFDYAVIGMALVSPEGRWLRVNRALCHLVGYCEEELLHTDFQTITHRDDLGNDLAEVYRMLTGEILTFQLEKRFIHKRGFEIWTSASASLVRDVDGRPLHFILQIQDITERKRAEAAIQTLSLVDELTGLYNRRGFMAFAEQLLGLVRNNKEVVLVYADLNDLKQINDGLGHKEGDRALIKTAELFKQTFRSSDVIGRLGGDEFTVLATVDPEHGVEGLIKRLEKKFEDFNDSKLLPYRLSISIGVAIVEPDSYHSIEDLLARADQAMYEDKRTRKKKPVFVEEVPLNVAVA
jgi:diguanylate cyclase (GGDEF)-like protein/PAS domain S-box-containing protein